MFVAVISVSLIVRSAPQFSIFELTALGVIPATYPLVEVILPFTTTFLTVAPLIVPNNP